MATDVEENDMKSIDRIRELLLEYGVPEEKINASFESLRQYNPVFYMQVANSEADEGLTMDMVNRTAGLVKASVNQIGAEASMAISRRLVDEHAEKKGKNN